MKTFIIRYYHTETQYRCGLVAYNETVTGSREVAVNIAQGKIRVGSYKFYDIQEQ
ncbi:MAG: hypothetical protein IKA12_01045 [Clostridia bacterium]|nr:hypothetical protein [Clostridia bacterium]